MNREGALNIVSDLVWAIPDYTDGRNDELESESFRLEAYINEQDEKLNQAEHDRDMLAHFIAWFSHNSDVHPIAGKAGTIPFTTEEWLHYVATMYDEKEK